jgi:DNA-binding beta-propeller fold protein YncE
MRPSRFCALAIALVLTWGFALAARVLPAEEAVSQGPARQAPASARGRVAWPPPPVPARIQFLRSLDPAAVRGRPSFLSRLWRVIVGPQEEPRMLQPYGIAVGPDRKIYVADTFARTVHVYDLGRNRYSDIRIDGESLIGVAVIGSRVFVTDSATSRLLCIDANGRRLWTLGREQGLERPTGLAAARDRLYVVDTLGHRVVVVSLAGAIIGSFGERGGGPGQFNFPTNIARGGDGRLYVTDSMNFRVQLFDADGGYLRAFGQLGDGSGDFDKPKGIAVDSAGHIYVVEGFNDVVQIFDESGRFLLSFGESGSGDGQFWLPSGIAIADDTVYVADSANRRVEMFHYLNSGP